MELTHRCLCLITCAIMTCARDGRSIVEYKTERILVQPGTSSIAKELRGWILPNWIFAIRRHRCNLPLLLASLLFVTIMLHIILKIIYLLCRKGPIFMIFPPDSKDITPFVVALNVVNSTSCDDEPTVSERPSFHRRRSIWVIVTLMVVSASHGSCMKYGN